MIQFFAPDGRPVEPHDTEDKSWWLQHGAIIENDFLAFCREKGLLRGVAPNPDRTSDRPGLPEFVYKGAPLDLKAQRMPFFEAQRLYGVPPRYAVTLNWQDILDTREHYPDCSFVFWLDWEAVHYVKRSDSTGVVTADVRIEPLQGIWLLSPEGLTAMADNALRSRSSHAYQRRTGDSKGNARGSLVLDVRRMKLVWLDRTKPAYEPPNSP